MLEFLVRSIVIGVGATLLFDIWGLMLNRVARLPAPNFALVGRWFAHLPRGRFTHDDIARTEPVEGELVIGWVAHYAIGILFAGALLAIWGLGWARNPTFMPALIVGLVTVGCGWFILQPGMGAGIAASRRANAWTLRAMNVAGHVVFAIGMYATALLTR
jgi:hypothetical protein